MCLLVEDSGSICPRAPPGVEATQPLPVAQSGLGGSPENTAGLVSPGPLAVAADGSVLIADRARDQILRWRDGTLSVVAGDALAGYVGDGLPATEAEIDGPGEIGIGPDGTIFFVDSGNSRIRAIAPDGVIRTVAGDGTVGNTGDGGPATAAAINPGGLAVSPTGSLYISSGSDIRVVDPNGIIHTLVAGGPPYGADVEVNGSPTAFFPDSMALDAQGDLVVFSFSPKLLFEVSPAGKVTELAANYATALSMAPDGSVLVAEHDAGIERVRGAAVAAAFGPADATGDATGHDLVADGVAEAPDGTVYADTYAGDGASDETGLYAISPDGAARPLAVSTPIAATLPADGAVGFPEAVYPPAHEPAVLASPTGCPSSQAVVPFDATATAAARRLVQDWGPDLAHELVGSDRAVWPALIADAVTVGPAGTEHIDSLAAAATDLYAPVIARACGKALVRDSLAAVIGPSPYTSVVLHLFVLDRNGTPLVYFVDA